MARRGVYGVQPIRAVGQTAAPGRRDGVDACTAYLFIGVDTVSIKLESQGVGRHCFSQ